MPLYWENYKRHGSRLSLCFTNFVETAIFRVIPLPCRKKYVAAWVKAQPCRMDSCPPPRGGLENKPNTIY